MRGRPLLGGKYTVDYVFDTPHVCFCIVYRVSCIVYHFINSHNTSGWKFSSSRLSSLAHRSDDLVTISNYFFSITFVTVYFSFRDAKILRYLRTYQIL
jgi:hypothetical protein